MTSPTWRHPLLIAGLLALAALAAHGKDVTFEYVDWDDAIHLTQNPHLAGGLTWEGFKNAWTDVGTDDNWVPLTRLSHMLAISLFGRGPAGHHAVNVALHAANAALLFLALHALTGSLWRSTAVGLLLAVHPVHVESVAWVSERRDVLSLFFGCLAIWMYACFARAGTRKRSLGLYLLVVLLGACSMFSKPTMVTLPCVLLLLDAWPLRRMSARTVSLRAGAVGWLVLEKLPLLAVAAVTSWLTVAAQKHGIIPVAASSPALRLVTFLRAYEAYLGMLVWPVNLLPLYSDTYRWSAVGVALGFGLLCAITYLAVRRGREQPYLLIGWLWFLGTMVPMLGLMQVGAQVYACRYAYWPFIGLYIAAAWAVGEAVSKLESPRVRGEVVAGTLALLAAAGIAGSNAQGRTWANTAALIGPALERNPPCDKLYTLQANVLAAAGDQAGEEGALRKAATSEPYHGRGLIDLAECVMGRRDVALTNKLVELAVIRFHCRDFKLYFIAGQLALHRGDVESAVKWEQKSLDLKPGNAQAVAVLGQCAEASGNLAGAEHFYRQAIAVNPAWPTYHRLLGQLLNKENRPAEAIGPLTRAVKIADPYEGAVAFVQLGLAYSRTSDFEKAAEAFHGAVARRPDWPVAWDNLGAALWNQGDSQHRFELLQAAVDAFAKAVQLDPHYARAVSDLARAKALMNHAVATRPAASAESAEP